MAAAALILITASGCSSGTPDRPVVISRTEASPFIPAEDGSNYLEPVYRNIPQDEMQAAAADMDDVGNIWPGLSVPTWITRIGSTWFIADCYHNQIIYSDSADAPGNPLSEWKVMTSDVTQAHTVAGDGFVYLADDTENNRVLIFERVDGKFINTQTFWNIGTRPHYTVYDETTDTFYVWSSRTGELYLFRRAKDTTDIYETEKRSIPDLNGIYIRSFTIMGDYIYFVSGIPSEENPDYTPAIYCCDLATLNVVQRYPVPDELAGMTQLFPLSEKCWLISISTDLHGNQDFATLIKADSLLDLEKGRWEDVYSTFFEGGGTPYYISRVGDDLFLTEHRLQDHAIWRFRADKKGRISDVTALY